MYNPNIFRLDNKINEALMIIKNKDIVGACKLYNEVEAKMREVNISMQYDAMFQSNVAELMNGIFQKITRLQIDLMVKFGDEFVKLKNKYVLLRRAGLSCCTRFKQELEVFIIELKNHKSVYVNFESTEEYGDLCDKVKEVHTLMNRHITSLRSKVIQRTRPKKKNIFELWKLHIGENWFGVCVCCKTNRISIENFIIGHVLAVDAGGGSELSNLRPICQPCNSDMGTAHMDDYIEYIKLTKK
ncbi:hypothetical protein F-LCD7_0237 [Faustovirus]|nr:hypothetical protein F-LCD7_0237 [Faustovirus]